MKLFASLFSVMVLFSVSEMYAAQEENGIVVSPVVMQEAVAVCDRLNELISELDRETEEAEERWSAGSLKALEEFLERQQAEGKSEQEIAMALEPYFENDDKEKADLVAQQKENTKNRIKELLLVYAPHLLAEVGVDPWELLMRV
jgi:hypothetical protein